MSDVTSGSAVAESPASAPAAEPSAPSTTPSSSAPAQNTPPRDFKDAWDRAGERATPDPVSETPPAVPGDAPTTVAPATEPVETVVATPEKDKTEKKGSIPTADHLQVVKNTREKTAKEVETKFRESHKDSLKFGEEFERDPVATTGKLIANLAQHPEFGPRLRAEAMKHLQQGTPIATTASEEPQPDFQTADGATFYSAAQLAKRETWLTQKITDQVKQSLIEPLSKQVEPLISREHKREQDERQAAVRETVNGEMKDLYGTYESQPYFKEHKAAIGERTLALMSEGKSPERAIALAYTEIVLSKGVADRQSQLTAAAVAKSTGSAVPPGSVVSASQPRPRDFKTAFASIKD